MKRFARAALVAVATGLAACSSAPPIHYHTLLAPGVQAATGAQPAPFLIEVLPVGVPVQADQPQLVVRQGESGLALLEGERWAGPLADEVRQALSAQLASGLATQDVAGLARPGGRQLMRVKVQIRRLDSWPGQRAQLEADWSLGMADEPGAARLTCSSRLDAAAPGGYPELVQAQQRLIAALADRIGTAARAWSRARGAACSDQSGS